MIFANTNTLAGEHVSAFLSQNDLSGLDRLTAIHLDAKMPWI